MFATLPMYLIPVPIRGWVVTVLALSLLGFSRVLVQGMCLFVSLLKIALTLQTFLLDTVRVCIAVKQCWDCAFMLRCDNRCIVFLKVLALLIYRSGWFSQL
ncbi:hypothetical protein M758_1G225000 [Ceratodon purpureus]|uniref:Uncharacterized protein n=1 Tax=Ceratodon purpureus TaxID=3225 RepID=A0A8T0J722_CERPU|nr:hypothetical protein KC19_1G194800 [Ceratodon purpureus]KAG0631069.1 hypothetical protein M758_1G225000 [Ceratodon purpureus]